MDARRESVLTNPVVLSEVARSATQSKDLFATPGVDVAEARNILCSPNRRALYFGVTTDLERRPSEHRLGRVSHTAEYNIRRLVYFELFDTAPAAIAREKQLKGWRRQRKAALIESVNQEWEDLAPE